MTSMSLKFILCAPEEKNATHTRKRENIADNLDSGLTAEISYSTFLAGRREKDDSALIALDRQQHTRQLQNLRQRRYRERKKSSASALQKKSELLHRDNSVLEAAIVERFESLT
ncbi:hypothetical protein PsorP6_017238 [Peronosclerospora sorghi]|uniref:Uncharacterized protein n=1 Tax=Peronosclerospora sorghi TaxID=230839 RepID=A0ACC0WLL3_9STRA|nr:hypothetical protein PsorP6_017238 [Peronosclerospora sorghi]